MQKIKKYLVKLFPFSILLLVIPAIRGLFTYGFFGVSDDLHVGWLYEMDRIVKMGQFPPRFAPDLSYGFGYPLFNFVYPLPFYFAEIFHLLGFSLVDSLKIIFGLSAVFSVYFMYLFLKELMPKKLALAGAVLYLYAPYRATEMFVRGVVGEIVAFVFIPLVALSFVKLTKEKPGLKWIGITSLSLAGLVLSHNIMAYMFLPFAVILLAARIIWLVKDKKAAIGRALAGIFLGLLVSVFFWWPAISESSLMHYGTVFNFYDHFPTLKQLITPFFGYGASVAGPYDGMSFYIGIIGLLVVCAGAILMIGKWKKYSLEEKIFMFWGIGILAVSVFMMNYRSAFLWRSLPFLPYFQFPWRFLSMVVFSIPIFLLVFSKIKFGSLIALVLIPAAIILNFNYFTPSEYLGRGDAYYINRYAAYPIASEDYKTTTEEYLRLPKGTDARPEKNYPRVYSDVNAIKQVEEITPLDAKIVTEYPDSFTLNYNKYNFPGFIAKIDGKAVVIKTGKPYGQISVSVPAGEHVVEIYYRESPGRLVFDYLSLAGLIATVGFILAGVKQKK